MTDDNALDTSLSMRVVAFRPERLKYPKAGAAVDDGATPSFLRREYMKYMDWIVGRVAKVHHLDGVTGTYVMQRWSRVTRRHTAEMGTKALRRGIAKLRSRKGG